METICPKCHSKEAEKIDIKGASCIVCSKCGYSECDEFDVAPGYRTSQKAKGEHNPYKAGGSNRVVKK